MTKEFIYYDPDGHNLDYALILSSSNDGVGSRPASTTTAGWAVTSNYAGFNEVDLWSTVNADGSLGQGFYFWQKLTNTTEQQLFAVYGDTTITKFDVFNNTGSFFASATEVGFSSVSDLPLNFYAFEILKLSLEDGKGAAIVGTPTNDNAASGNFGEYISSNIVVANKVSLTTATSKTITSISLTAGDWDVTGTVAFAPDAGTLIVDMKGGISQTNNTLPTLGDTAALVDLPLAPSAGVGATIPVGASRISLASTTTIYLVAQCTFTVNTNGAYGFISARRVR